TSSTARAAPAGARVAEEPVSVTFGAVAGHAIGTDPGKVDADGDQAFACVQHAQCFARRRSAQPERPSGHTAAQEPDEFSPSHGAYPKAKDHGRSIAGGAVGQWRASQ